MAVLPDQGSWYNSDTKMYETIVTIDEDVEDLKPGMTAVVEIHVDELQDVLAVPVQAVVQEQKSTFVYVQRNGPERQEIEVGGTNDKLVEVTAGLSEGDLVVLNPMDVTEYAGNFSQGLCGPILVSYVAFHAPTRHSKLNATQTA